MNVQTGSALMTLGFLALCSFAVIEARDWPITARFLPLLVGIPAIVLAVAQLFYDLTWKKRKNDERVEITAMDEVVQSRLPRALEMQRTVVFFGWLAIITIGVWLFGITLALPAFVLTFSWLQGEKWWSVLALTAMTILFVSVLFERVLGIMWPDGVLFEWFAM